MRVGREGDARFSFFSVCTRLGRERGCPLLVQVCPQFLHEGWQLTAQAVEVRLPQVLTQHPWPEIFEGDSLKDIALGGRGGECEHRLRQNLVVPQ